MLKFKPSSLSIYCTSTKVSARVIKAASHAPGPLSFIEALMTSPKYSFRDIPCHSCMNLTPNLCPSSLQLHLYWRWETLRGMVLEKSKKKGPSCLGKKVVGMTL